MTGPVRLLVLQWAHPGGGAALADVEDELTPLARRHGAVVDRDRAGRFRGFGDPAQAPPDEVHLVTFPDEEALEAFLADPDREPLRVRLGEALARTDVWVLDAIDDDTRGRVGGGGRTDGRPDGAQA